MEFRRDDEPSKNCTEPWGKSEVGVGEELYDETQDPLEWTNLAGKADYASIKQELAREDVIIYRAFLLIGTVL